MKDGAQEKQKAVVTGANGFVGSHLVERLVSEGYAVTCILRKTSNSKWIDALPIEIVRCGLEEVEAMRDVVKDATYIFHVAGLVRAKNKEAYLKGNVEMTENVLKAALGASSIQKIIVVSSLASTGPTKVGQPVEESDPFNPVSLYGESKKAQEILVAEYQARLPIVIVRPPAVFGERDSDILIYFQSIKKGVFAQIGFRPKTLSMVHVKDLVYGFILAAEKGKVGEAYFLGSIQPEYSWDEITAITAKILNKQPIKLRVPHFMIYVVGGINQFFSFFRKGLPTLNLDKANEIIQDSWSCKSEKARRDLGYSEAKPIAKRIEETLTWYKEKGWM